jgi:hypothetical protein
MSFDQSVDPSAGKIGHHLEANMNFNEIVGVTGQPEVGVDGQRGTPQGQQPKRVAEKPSFWANIMK